MGTDRPTFRHTWRAAITLPLAIALGCAAGGGSSGGGRLAPEEDVSFTVLAAGEDAGAAATGIAATGGDLVIATEPDLAAFLASAPGVTLASPPAVDFASEFIVAVALGARDFGGYAIGISRVVRDRETGALTIEVTEEKPADLAAAPARTVRPYALAIVADKNVLPKSGGSASAPPPVMFRHLERLKFETIDKGPHSCWESPELSPIDRPHLLAFRDKASWEDFWKQHSCGRLVPIPSIDFRKDMAIAYIAAERSGASAAEILEILYDRQKETIYVEVVEDRRPSAISVAEKPFHIVLCPNVPGELVLRLDLLRPFRTLDIGAISGYRYGDPSFSGENMVVRAERPFFRLWAEHVSNQSPPPPPPSVYFPREMALASFFGYWPSSGASIEIVRIVETWSSVLRVELRRIAAPGPLDVITNPFHMVATAAWPGRVIFVER
jgi:hypothetical protein